jgi:two-component system, OmpR family, phosphate regulon sensor histidine kinase PhoR
LVGLGRGNQHWEMRTVPLSQDARLVLLQDQSALAQAERMRSDFVANASHELRTPLAAISGFIETLQDDSAGGDPATRRRFLSVIDAEARRMQQLVDDLISLSRIEAGKYQPPEVQVDVAALLRQVRGELAAMNPKRAANIVLEIGDAPQILTADAAQLSQMFHNLIGNAMKYGRADTPITVALSHPRPDMMQISVVDEGDGIDEEHLPRLTERFYRVDSARSRALGGTGLGLSIVKHSVERHKGRLDISSVKGKGTTISVLLPK